VLFMLDQADVFRWRTYESIYRFGSEEEKLSWLSILGQAAAVILARESFDRVHYHDYHACASLLHLPRKLSPMVMYTAYSPDDMGSFLVGSVDRWTYLASMFGLVQLHLLLGNAMTQVPAAARWRRLPAILRDARHLDCFNLVKAVVSILNETQQGAGVVMMSEQHAAEAREKLSVFWGLPKAAVCGMTCTLPPANETLAGQYTFEEDCRMYLPNIMQEKANAKKLLQEAYGLDVDPCATLLVFLGRMTYQKVKCQLTACGPCTDWTPCWLVLSCIAICDCR
jgi:hypothetical protein